MSSSKRLLAVAGAVAAGFAGAFTFVAPASAHFAVVSGAADCTADGKPVVKWVVKNVDDHAMKINELTPEAGVGKIVKDATVAPKETVTVEQVVSADAGKVTLKFHPTWSDGYSVKDRNAPGYFASGNVDIPAQGCKKPAGAFNPKCDGTSTLRLLNPAREDSKFTVTIGGKPQVITVPGGKTSEIQVPVDAGKVTLTWGDKSKDFTWSKPESCNVPALVTVPDCNGATIRVENPDNSNATPVKVVVGKNTRTDETLAPGKTIEVKIGREDHPVTSHVTIGDVTREVVYTTPANCGASLPMTGTNTALIAGAAVLLVGTGAGLFFFTRRRRVRFTA